MLADSNKEVYKRRFRCYNKNKRSAPANELRLERWNSVMNESSTTKKPAQDLGVKGWLMVAYLFVCFYLSPSVSSGWQSFIGYWADTYQWDTTWIMSLLSIGQVICIGTCFVFPRMVNKVPLHSIQLVLAAVTTVCLFVLPHITSYTLMCVIEVVLVCAVITWVYGLNPILIARWFPHKKGIVMGIVTIAVPLGAGTISKIVSFIGGMWGLNYGCMFSAVLSVVALVMLVVFVKDYPEDAGYAPDNDRTLSSEQIMKMQAEVKEQDAKSPWTVARMLSVKETWIIGLTIGAAGLFGGGVMSTNFLFMLSIGYEASMAGNLMLFTALCGCVFSYLFGLLDAKKSPRVATMFVFVSAMVSSVFCILAQKMDSFVLLIIGLAMAGAVVGGAANFLTSLTAEYWGPANFSRAYSVIYPINQIISSMGVLFITQISTNFGGYVASYTALLVLETIALLLFAVVKNGDFVKNAEEAWKKG